MEEKVELKGNNIENFIRQVQELSNKLNVDFCMITEGGKFLCSSTKKDDDILKAINAFQFIEKNTSIIDFMDLWILIDKNSLYLNQGLFNISNNADDNTYPKYFIRYNTHYIYSIAVNNGINKLQDICTIDFDPYNRTDMKSVMILSHVDPISAKPVNVITSTKIYGIHTNLVKHPEIFDTLLGDYLGRKIYELIMNLLNKNKERNDKNE